MKRLREINLGVRQWLTVLVDARDAEWALAKSAGNRPVSRRTVSRYREIMEDGNWQDDHPDPIIFDQHARLMNGQHRMRALAELGDKQFLMAVRTMEPMESIMAIDTGYKRKPADQIRMYADINVPNSLISSVRYWDHENNTIISHEFMNRGLVSPQKYLAVVESHPEEVALVAQFFTTNTPGITNGAVGCAMLVGAKVAPMQTMRFMSELKNPASTIEQVAMLKTWLLSSARTMRWGTDSQQRTAIIFEHALYALQAYIDGRPFTRWPTSYPRTIRGNRDA